VIWRTVGECSRGDDPRIELVRQPSAGAIAMTSENETIPAIETVVSDLWRSFFGATFDALRGALRRLGA
jgi:hypothetical protein